VTIIPANPAKRAAENAGCQQAVAEDLPQLGVPPRLFRVVVPMLDQHVGDVIGVKEGVGDARPQPQADNVAILGVRAEQELSRVAQHLAGVPQEKGSGGRRRLARRVGSSRRHLAGQRGHRNRRHG
jgi:hypothetical protein